MGNGRGNGGLSGICYLTVTRLTKTRREGRGRAAQAGLTALSSADETRQAALVSRRSHTHTLLQVSEQRLID